MRHIPQLKAQLDRPRSFRSDRYAFSNCISFFTGAGKKIMSKSCQVAIGDEVDEFPVIGKLDNVADLKKRTRSYDSSILFLVCTPTQVTGKIWRSFLKSSQGYWHLRCQKCGDLTMRSCDIHNLQFQSTYDENLKEYLVKPQSIRLICPVCGFEHTEDMKRAMNINRPDIYIRFHRELKTPQVIRQELWQVNYLHYRGVLQPMHSQKLARKPIQRRRPHLTIHLGVYHLSVEWLQKKILKN